MLFINKNEYHETTFYSSRSVFRQFLYSQSGGPEIVVQPSGAELD